MSAVATSILRAIAKAEAQVWSGGQGFPLLPYEQGESQ
jgi:hypothetical protein